MSNTPVKIDSLDSSIYLKYLYNKRNAKWMRIMEIDP